MNNEHIHLIVRKAARLATREAMNGRPAGITWLPPQITSDNPLGNFIIEPYGPFDATETPPWEK